MVLNLTQEPASHVPLTHPVIILRQLSIYIMMESLRTEAQEQIRQVAVIRRAMDRVQLLLLDMHIVQFADRHALLYQHTMQCGKVIEGN